MTEYSDRPGYSFNPGPPPEASRFLKNKGLKTAFSWQDVEPEEHAVAFTVAKAMQIDVLTAIRHHCTVADAGWRLFQNGERHLRPRAALVKLYRPQWMAETVRIAQRCTFSMEELRYTYPHELVPVSHTPTSWLRQLTEVGARWRWPDPPVVAAVAFNAAVIFGFSQAAWLYLARTLPPVASSISVMLIPVLGVFSGAFFLQNLSENRSDNVSLLNFRLDKSFKVGRYELQGMLDIYNVLNNDAVTNFNLNAGAGYKTVIAVLDPRVFQVGVRFEF